MSRSEYPLDPEELKRRLRAMHASYRTKVPAKIEAIEALWQRVRTAAPADEARRDLFLAAHTLVGSAPTLGCEPLGAAARELEIALRAAFARNAPVSEDEALAIGRLVAALKHSLG